MKCGRSTTSLQCRAEYAASMWRGFAGRATLSYLSRKLPPLFPRGTQSTQLSAEYWIQHEPFEVTVGWLSRRCSRRAPRQSRVACPRLAKNAHLGAAERQSV